MKIILTLFIFSFSSSVFANNISDFQIEGMSIGDSLLDYFSEEKIKLEFPYKKKTFGSIVLFDEYHKIDYSHFISICCLFHD